MSKRHVLVTGGAGFIGSHVVERLLGRGDRVTVLDNFNDFYDPQVKRQNLRTAGQNPDLTLVEADLREGQILEQLCANNDFTAVIHLAARAGVRPSLQQPELYEAVNVLGTLKLLEACRRHGPRTLILGSSSSVYGVNSKVPFAEEDAVDQPISPYAVSKRAAELMAFNHHHLYGLRITALRFFSVYGPRQRPEMAIHRFVRRIIEGKTLTLYGDGSTRRDYTYIDDIVDGVVAALDLAPGYEIVNLGGSETTSLSELVRALARELAVEPRIEYLPDQPGDVPITYAEITKAQQLLGYRPKVGIDEGLRRFVAWYRAPRS